MAGWEDAVIMLVSPGTRVSLNTLGKEVDDYKGSYSLVPVVQVTVDVGQEGKPILLNSISAWNQHLGIWNFMVGIEVWHNGMQKMVTEQ